MYPRVNYEMTEEDLKKILESCKPVACMMIGGYTPASPQENANMAWTALGKKMGFDGDTVNPIPGKGNRFFTAVPSETAEQKAERIEIEEKQKRDVEMSKLEAEIAERQERLDRMKAKP